MKGQMTMIATLLGTLIALAIIIPAGYGAARWIYGPNHTCSTRAILGLGLLMVFPIMGVVLLILSLIWQEFDAMSLVICLLFIFPVLIILFAVRYTVRQKESERATEEASIQAQSAEQTGKSPDEAITPYVPPSTAATVPEQPIHVDETAAPVQAPAPPNEVPKAAPFVAAPAPQTPARKLPLILCIVLALALIASCVLNFYLYSRGILLQSQIGQLGAKAEEQSITITNLTTQLDDANMELQQSAEDLSHLQTLYGELYDKKGELEEAAEFLYTYIAIIPDDGTGLLHNYACRNLDLSNFWAYNIDTALEMGYDVCPDCERYFVWPPLY